MAIQTVNVGTVPNDGTGDPARTAFIKVNDNFTQAENAASKLVATNAQAIAGTAGVLPDAAGVHAAFKQYGLGTQNTPAMVDPNQVVISGFYSGAGATGINFEGSGAFCPVIVAGRESGDRAMIISCDVVQNTVRFKSRNAGISSAWAELFHSGNMDPDLANGLNSPRLMRNVSGATVNNEATTAGSGLRFCNFGTTGVLTASATAGTGTWKNISGTALAANEYGLFVRIA